MTDFQLTYWGGGKTFQGRGEFVYLLFLETGTPVEYTSNVKEMKKTYAVFALRLLWHKSKDLVLDQTMSIIRYLAQVLDNGRLFPKDLENQAKADIIVTTVADIIEQGMAATHPLAMQKSFAENKGPLQDDRIQWFEHERKEICYADIVYFQFLLSVEAICPTFWKNEKIPKSRRILENVGIRPAIAQRVSTRIPFDKETIAC